MSWIPGWGSIADASWWSGFFFWASILSLIGLGVSEVASHRYSERKDELVAEQQLQEKKQHDDEIAGLNLETAKITREAEVARSGIAAANERAAEANRAAEAEKLERIKLEAKLAPRRLSPEQSRALGALKPFRGTHIKLVRNLGDPEVEAFSNDFVPVFTEAGWPHQGGFDGAMFTIAPIGIEVTISTAEAEANRIPEPVKVLVGTLKSLGITVTGKHNPGIATIEFRVGTKPPP